MYERNADPGALVGGLEEKGQAGLSGQHDKSAFRVCVLLLIKDSVSWSGNASRIQKHFCQGLIHTDRTGSRAGACIPDPGQLQGTLETAVFSKSSVQGDEHEVGTGIQKFSEPVPVKVEELGVDIANSFQSPVNSKAASDRRFTLRRVSPVYDDDLIVFPQCRTHFYYIPL